MCEGEYIMSSIISKEPFRFSYNVPSLDWYTTKDVEINWDDYSYFKLELSFYKCSTTN